MIFKNNIELKQNNFKNEKELQNFFEMNIEKILGYKFIESEFIVGNFRIDTLAFDEETKAFKIIEYKNVKNNSLVDQGYTYLKLMLERKADFVLKYNINKKTCLSIKDIDWTQSRILFISPSFTSYQLNATDFKNIPIDLIKVNRYENDVVDIDFINKTSNVKIEEMNEEFKQNKVNKEIVVYTEEEHLNKVSEDIKKLYEELKNRILELDDIDIDVKKVYIAFKGRKNIIDIKLFKTKICVFLNLKNGELKDFLNIAENISDVGHHGNGDYRVLVKNPDDIDNIIPLIKQSIKINKK